MIRLLGELAQREDAPILLNLIGHSPEPVQLAALDAFSVFDSPELAEQLFALPFDAKCRYETPHDGRQRGYTSFGKEHAKDQKHGDLKEFWHVGRELGDEHPLHVSGDVPPNQFPTELPAFRPTFLELFDRFGAAIEREDHVGRDALDALECVRLIEAAYESARDLGREVAIERAAVAEPLRVAG